MAALLGLALGCGLFLLWWSLWSPPTERPEAARTDSRLRVLIAQSGIQRLSPAGVVSAMAVGGLVVGLLVLSLTGTWTIAACFAVFGAAVPWLLLSWQARRRSTALRELWPDAIDHARSAIRAGLTLPEALIQLGETGPEGLRRRRALDRDPGFAAFWDLWALQELRHRRTMPEPDLRLTCR